MARIGVTSGLGGPHWLPDGTSWFPYAEAVRRAGGEPVYLTNSTLGQERAILETLDGVLFTGGKDIDVRMYPKTGNWEWDRQLDPTGSELMARYRMQPEADRDEYEIPLLLQALQLDLPVLGICRGCQVMNVALGGTLYLDIPIETGAQFHRAEPSPSDNSSSIHPIEIDPASRLSDILCPRKTRQSNSRHHQAVRDLAPGVTATAISSEDGLVEAVEIPSARWAVGVQWHPEHPADPEIVELHRPLFEALVAACRGVG